MRSSRLAVFFFAATHHQSQILPTEFTGQFRLRNLALRLEKRLQQFNKVTVTTAGDSQNELQGLTRRCQGRYAVSTAPTHDRRRRCDRSAEHRRAMHYNQYHVAANPVVLGVVVTAQLIRLFGKPTRYRS